MQKRIFQLVGLTIGLLLGWRLGIIFLERTAPRRLVPQPASEPARAAGPASAAPPPQPRAEAEPAATNASSNGLDLESETLVYCLGCREKRQVVNAHEERLANGRLALKGECAVCGRTVMRFIRES